LGTAIPYSDIDKFLSDERNRKGCLLDTNFLIALTEENHKFNEDSSFIFEKLVQYQVPIYCTVTVRTEFIDYQRKIIVTESLMDMLAPSSKWRISTSVREALRRQRGWIDNQAKEDDLPVLTDSRIKDMKRIFLPRTASGHIGWVEICKAILAGKLLNAWSDVERELSLNYVDMREGKSANLFPDGLKWEKMYSLAETTALSSNDAMILNVLESSSLPFVVSADYDLAYGVMKSSEPKAILVPDSLYARHLKKIKF
jgi:predicted nucleic acid-binding protein